MEMITTPVKKRKRDVNEEEELLGTPGTPIDKALYSDESDSPGFNSEVFRNETFSPSIVTWDTIRPKASPRTTAAAKRINREIKQHAQARRKRSKLLAYSDNTMTITRPFKLYKRESIEKYKQHVAEIHNRIKNVFQGCSNIQNNKRPEVGLEGESHKENESVIHPLSENSKGTIPDTKKAIDSINNWRNNNRDSKGGPNSSYLKDVTPAQLESDSFENYFEDDEFFSELDY